MGKGVLGILCLVTMIMPSRAASQAESKASRSDSTQSGQKSESKAPAENGSKKSDDVQKLGGAPVDPKAYVIGAEDVLMIRVWREPELSGQISVRPDGKISLPLMGETQAAGLSPEGLATALGNGLSKFMNRPEVTVAVMQVNSKRYFIQGEVQKPGAYPLVVPTTVLEALVNAGGFRDFANTKKIRIMRGTQVFRFNYKEVLKQQKLAQNIELKPGDTVVVP